MRVQFLLCRSHYVVLPMILAMRLQLLDTIETIEQSGDNMRAQSEIKSV